MRKSSAKWLSKNTGLVFIPFIPKVHKILEIEGDEKAVILTLSEFKTAASNDLDCSAAVASVETQTTVLS